MISATCRALSHLLLASMRQKLPITIYCCVCVCVEYITKEEEDGPDNLLCVISVAHDEDACASLFRPREKLFALFFFLHQFGVPYPSVTITLSFCPNKKAKKKFKVGAKQDNFDRARWCRPTFFFGGDLTPGPRLHSDYCRPNYTRRAQFLLGSRRARNLCVWRQPRPTEGNQENEVLMTTSIVLPMQMRPTSQKGKHTHRENTVLLISQKLRERLFV